MKFRAQAEYATRSQVLAFDAFDVEADNLADATDLAWKRLVEKHPRLVRVFELKVIVPRS